MKITVKIFLLAAAVLLIAASCQKDENGNRITYYKNKTGEGYVFFKFKNDSIAPIENAIIKIESYTVGMFSTITRHYDYVYTDNNGKYSFKFVKKICSGSFGNYKVAGYEIFSSLPIGYDVSYSSGNYIRFKHDLLDNSNKIFNDTIFYYPDKH